MEWKYLSAGDFRVLIQNFPGIVDWGKRQILLDTIGTYSSRVLELLPENLHPDLPWEIQHVLMAHSEYVGLKVAELLWSTATEWEQKQLGCYYLSEMMRNKMGNLLWRSNDARYIYEYSLLDHWDTFVGCHDTINTDNTGYLSFTQTAYPLILSLLAFAKAIDTTWENTIRAWDWQTPFFEGHNPWKGRGLEIIPYREDDIFHILGHIIGHGLFEEIPKTYSESITFSLRNGKSCYPILDRTNQMLSFYVEHSEGHTQIGRRKFRNDFILQAQDLEGMFKATAHLVARDWKELLYGIMEYFPYYYKTIAPADILRK